MRRVNRDVAIALIVAGLVVAEMAVDHLVGTEAEPGEDGLADPGAFVLSVALSLALLGVLFGVLVPKARKDLEGAARYAIASSVLAVPALALVFLGLPLPLAGAGISLGWHARRGRRTSLAAAAIALGGAVIALTVVAYLAALAD